MSNNIFSTIIQEGKFAPDKGRFARTVDDPSIASDGMSENMPYLIEAKNALQGQVFKSEINFAISSILESMSKDTYERCEAMAEALQALYARYEQMSERYDIVEMEKQDRIQTSLGIEEASHLPPSAPVEL